MRIINKTICIITILLLSAEVFAAKILISKTVDHPAIDATTKGVIDGLEQAGYSNSKGSDIKVESAQGSIPLASQIASKFTSQNPDIILAIGTVSAKSFVKYANNGLVKVIFSTVTDPLGAGLVKSLDNPGGNISGVSNFVPLKPQIELFKKLQPNLKRLGIIYNPAELNSAAIVAKLEFTCKETGLLLIKQTISNTASAAQGAARLASDADAIFISNDNTALSALQSIIAVANKNNLPVYVSDVDAVKLGAKAALGPNQYDIGLQTAKMVVKVLEGENISKIKVEFPDKTDLVINERQKAVK